MESFASWLMGALSAACIWLGNVIIDLLQMIFDGFFLTVIYLVTLFPEGPVLPAFGTSPTSQTWIAFVTSLNWIFPVTYLVQLVAYGVASMVAYFLIAPLARWAKLLT